MRPAGRPTMATRGCSPMTNPVASVHELRDTGELDHTVSTKLVPGIIEDIYRTGV